MKGYKRFFSLCFLISIFVICLFVIIFNIGLFQSHTDPIQIKIVSGSSGKEISRQLQKENVIIQETFFLIAGKLTQSLNSFRPGLYEFKSKNVFTIINKLKKGNTLKVKVTLLEGWSSFQIAEKLKETGILKEITSFLQEIKDNDYEGRLFPSTYFFDLESDSKHVIRQILKHFDLIYLLQWHQHAEKKWGWTQKQVLTLASIIEREAFIDEERPTISSVYHNRLKKGMMLEADPTVQYALGLGRSWKKNLRYRHLKVESPYNTYRRRGLPPGPICNPGKASIHAALFPEKTDYLYFVAEGESGRHQFSKTYKQHQIYRKQFKKKKIELRLKNKTK